MRKIKSEIHPRYCSYLWFGRSYDKKPPFTVVRYYLVDEYSDVKARLRIRFLPLPLLAIIGGYLLAVSTSHTMGTAIQIPDYMTVNQGVLSVDIKNTGDHPAMVQLYEVSGHEPLIWLEQEILPGTSISNVKLRRDLPVGERTIKIHIVMENGNRQSAYTNEMIVRVESDWSQRNRSIGEDYDGIQK